MAHVVIEELVKKTISRASVSGLTVVYCPKFEECEQVAKELKLRGIAEVTATSSEGQEAFLKHVTAINGKAVVVTRRFQNITVKASLRVHWGRAVQDHQEEQYSGELDCATNGIMIMIIANEEANTTTAQQSKLRVQLDRITH
ncbi:hypothetical protein Pelo_9584 [Pelomyxa schiedti]|nr:hypothetical protein Pelo_9584 [Pelomyxa schiedti]